MSNIDTDVLLIMSGCAFDTPEQMNAAYEIGSIALAGYRRRVIEDAAALAYKAVDAHLWDATVAARVRDSILLPQPPSTPNT